MSANSDDTHSPFAPLQLTFDEQKHCQDLSIQLLDRTLHSYDERLAGHEPRHHASLDSARWKLQKTQANASLYSERIRHVRTDLHLPEDSWENPTVLLVVGTIEASLDEVMFGVAIPTFDTLKIRASTLGNQDLGGAMLARLVGPTEEEPFQSLAIMYMTSQLPWLVSKVVKPRDFVLLSASGVITCTDGERIGYDLLQPAPLPQCPPLPKPMIRGKFMYGALYRQQEDGNVDVYIQQYVEAQGNVLDSFIMNSTWVSLLGFLDSPRLSELKKLEWCIANVKGSRRRQMVSDFAGYSWRCSLCSVAFRRNIRGRTEQQNCVLCSVQVCSNCYEERSLLNRQGKGASVRKVHVVVCRLCLKFVQEQSPVIIARHQHLQLLTPASSDTGGSVDGGRLTWGLLDEAATPSWSPRKQLSSTGETFQSLDLERDILSFDNCEEEKTN